ncbi:dUTPase [Staphylococcus cohnii]|uniref:dUTPase n=1 Tax=Staphylococcus cohnii TaxID=29382 RepID=UPI000317487F|nr:dUTPase [Staphylococcus cohnii]
MINTITVDQLEELLQIQKGFDSRIPTLNLQDSKVAYVVEFFEWFNTLETFKNWKKKPGKPIDVQLDELADMLAFGLSIANQQADDMEEILDYIEDGVFTDYLERVEIDFNDRDMVDDFMSYIDEIYNGSYANNLFLPFAIANNYYTIDQLITAYKKKMERNHARQDGTADKDKGYI